MTAAEKLAERLKPEHLIEAVKALAAQDEDDEEEEEEACPLEDFERDVWQRALGDLLNSSGGFVDQEYQEVGSLETALQTYKAFYLRLREVRASLRVDFFGVSYDDMPGTEIVFDMLRFSPNSGAMLETDFTDDWTITAKLVSGDLQQALYDTARAHLAPGFRDNMWGLAEVELSSGHTLAYEKDYPSDDESFWDRILKERGENYEAEPDLETDFEE